MDDRQAQTHAPTRADHWHTVLCAPAGRSRLSAASTTRRFAEAHPTPEAAARALAGLLGASADAPVVLCKQEHTDHILDAPMDFPGGVLGVGDAIAVRGRGRIAAVRTADCVPMIVADEEAEVLVAVHAGWKGVLAGLPGKAVRHALALGARAQCLRILVGPCIRQRNYEVSPELAAEFEARWGRLGSFVDGRLVDLPGLASAQAAAEGAPAGSLEDHGACTLSDDRWPSHRRQGRARLQVLTAAVILP